VDGLRILAIDDQREILDVVQLALELTTDWSLTMRRSAAEALASHDDAAYDVVLLDLNIPGEKAGSTVARLRDQGIGSFVALLTGSPVADGERRRIGADLVLTKPFDPMTLAAQIEAALS
jgi:DNA-binding response OmpR family regulator